MREIRVQMPAGVTNVSVGGHEYSADDKGIVTLNHPDHVAPLVNSHGGVEVDEDGQPGKTLALIGTDRFPSEVEIREGEEPRPLASIVAETKERSGTNDDEWNNLPQTVRDLLISLHVGELRGDFGNVADVRASLEAAEKARREAEDKAAALDGEKGQLSEALDAANADKATAENARAEAVAENDRLRAELDSANAKVAELVDAAGKSKKGGTSES